MKFSSNKKRPYAKYRQPYYGAGRWAARAAGGALGYIAGGFAGAYRGQRYAGRLYTKRWPQSIRYHRLTSNHRGRTGSNRGKRTGSNPGRTVKKTHFNATLRKYAGHKRAHIKWRK